MAEHCAERDQFPSTGTPSTASFPQCRKSGLSLFQFRPRLDRRTPSPCPRGTKGVAFVRDERAATAIEYGLIVTGIALGTLAVLSGIGAKIAAAFLLLQAAV
jgi:pilus assembly protein Flp/PilA